MGSETPLTHQKPPIIDFSTLKPENPSEWESAKSQVRKAIEELGFFEASFDKIPSEARKEIFEALKELFDLPLETKQLNISKRQFRGYVGQYAEAPLYESLGIEDSNIDNTMENFTNLMWPQGNPSFCKIIKLYSDKLLELDQLVRKIILESLGIEKHLEEHLDSTYYLLRVMKYTAPQTTETKLGLNSHTDKNFITILYQNQIEGLEFLTKDGHWISLKPSPDSFIVLVGDSLHAWTNGIFHSPYHRVMMSGNEARYSVGLFSIPKIDYLLKVPEELVDEKHPLKFKPFYHPEFLKFYYTEAGQKAESCIKAYCGV